ncbi:MAG: GWxTD domain-containing protein [Flavobacteriales bacterium]
MSTLRGLLTFLALFLGVSNVFGFRAYFDYRVFHNPGQGPYIEFMTSFEGATFALAPAASDASKFQSAVELTLVVSQNAEVKDFRKVMVDGPLVAANQPADFFSLERFALPNGRYTLEIEIRDTNDPAADVEKLVQQITIDNPNNLPFISDIEFISAYSKTEEENAFSKSGYDILPYMSSYFPSSVPNIVFYAEVYHSTIYPGKDEAFIIVTTVTDMVGVEIPDTKRIKRVTGKDAIPLILTTDISKVPSGEYKLRVEAFDKNNTSFMVRERKFSRSLIQEIPLSEQKVSAETINASFASLYTNRDSLVMVLQSHLPISKAQERNTIDNVVPTADLVTLQGFFYTFWYRRNPENPEKAWKDYEKQVKDVQEFFGTRIKKGWQTDRGRVYLQYGAPNTRVTRPNDPDYWPFEIWHYYETNDGLHDRRFLFVNTTLAQDYELLHSDVPQETKNQDWPNLVRSRTMNTPSEVNRSSNSQSTDPFLQDELMQLWYTPH